MYTAFPIWQTPVCRAEISSQEKDTEGVGMSESYHRQKLLLAAVTWEASSAWHPLPSEHLLC